jgi:hypothetical protein
MKCAFKYPAVEHAKKELIEFAIMSFEPCKFFVQPERAFLTARATAMEEVTATP